MKDKRIEELSILKEEKYLSLYDATYKNKKGDTKHWTIASRKKYEILKEQIFNDREEKQDAVVIVAYNIDQKKLVFIRQFRIPLNDYVYELPAGLIDGDESMEISTIRELKEETGMDVIDINYNKTKRAIYASAGMTDESFSMVYCTCRGDISYDYLEDDEDIEVVLVSKEEAMELIAGNGSAANGAAESAIAAIKFDVKAYLILQSFALLGERMIE
ncbi:MAG: NUDIX hydrolase [Clostridiaceae bacterium]